MSQTVSIQVFLRLTLSQRDWYCAVTALIILYTNKMWILHILLELKCCGNGVSEKLQCKLELLLYQFWFLPTLQFTCSTQRASSFLISQMERKIQASPFNLEKWEFYICLSAFVVVVNLPITLHSQVLNNLLLGMILPWCYKDKFLHQEHNRFKLAK